jgi:hypothetical protein
MDLEIEEKQESVSFMWNLISKDERLKLLSTILPNDIDKEKFIFTNNAVFDEHKKNFIIQKIFNNEIIGSRNLVESLTSLINTNTDPKSKRLIPIIASKRNIYSQKVNKGDDIFTVYIKNINQSEINIPRKPDETIVKINSDTQKKIKDQYGISVLTDNENIFSSIVFTNSIIAIRLNSNTKNFIENNSGVSNTEIITNGTYCNIIGFYYVNPNEGNAEKTSNLFLINENLKNSEINRRRIIKYIFELINIKSTINKINDIHRANDYTGYKKQIINISKFNYLSLFDPFETGWKNGYIKHILTDNITKQKEYLLFRKKNGETRNELILLYEIFSNYPFVDKYFEYFNKSYTDIINKYKAIGQNRLRLLDIKKDLKYKKDKNQMNEDIQKWMESEIDKIGVNKIKTRSKQSEAKKPSDKDTKRSDKDTTEFKKQLLKYRSGFDKLLQQKNEAIVERMKFDRTTDEQKKYQIFDLIYNKFTIKKMGANNQYYLIDAPNIAILCEHEMILMKIYKLTKSNLIKNENQIHELYRSLELKFLSSTIDNDEERYVYCVFCGMPIFETEIKMHNTFDESGNLNVNYTTKMDIFQNKVMKQIDQILKTAQLIFINKGSIMLNARIIYDSILSFVSSYLTEEERDNLINFQKEGELKISKRMDRTIAEYVISRIIYGIMESNNMIYPRGLKKKIENLENDPQELNEYLLNWGIKKLFSIRNEKLAFRPFSNDLLSKKENIKNNLKKIIKRFKKVETKLAKYIFNVPVYYKYNENYENIIKMLLNCFVIKNSETKQNDLNFTKKEISVLNINICITRIINERKDIYDLSNYILARILSQETKLLSGEIGENIEIHKQNEKSIDAKQQQNKGGASSGLKGDMGIYRAGSGSKGGTGSYRVRGSPPKTQFKRAEPFSPYIDTNKLRVVLKIILEFINKKIPYQKNYLLNQLSEKLTKNSKKIEKEISETIHKEYNEVTDKIVIEYFQLHCFDGTPHLFESIFCTNCGRTIHELDSIPNLKKYKSQYIKLNTTIKKEIPFVKCMIKCEKYNEKINEILEWNLTDKIKSIVKKILSNINLGKTNSDKIEKDNISLNKNLKQNKFSKNLVDIVLTKNSDKFINLLLTLGMYKNREAESLGTSKKNRNIIIGRFKRLRIEFLYNEIMRILRDISIICNNKIIAFIKNISNGEMLLEYIEKGISENLKYAQNKIKNVVTTTDLNNIKCSELELNKQIKILHGLYIFIVDSIIQNKKSEGKEELLCNFITSEINITIKSTDDNDKTLNNFLYDEMNYDLDRYKKEQKYLNLSMEEKIEEGILNMTYEEQEEYFRALEEKGNDYFGLNIELNEKTQEELELIEEQKNVKSAYNEGIKMDIDYDYENEEVIDEREDMISQQSKNED